MVTLLTPHHIAPRALGGTLLFMAFFMVCSMTWGQESSPAEPPLQMANQQRLQVQRTGMLVLGSWAVGNMLVGGVGWARTEGTTRSFHQMNVMWNVVNLGLAAGSYYSALNSDPTSLDLWGSMQAQNNLEKIFLFNAGLDVGYMAGGLWMVERGRRLATGTKADRFTGWGRSVLLQGGFLFVFDLAMYAWVHQGASQLQPLLANLSPSSTGVGLVYNF